MPRRSNNSNEELRLVRELWRRRGFVESDNEPEPESSGTVGNTSYEWSDFSPSPLIGSEGERQVNKKEKCGHCKKLFSMNKLFASSNNKYLCRNCYNTYYIPCNICGDLILKKNPTSFKNRKYYFCPKCKTKAFFKCSSCGCKELVSHQYSSPDGKRQYCYTCYNKLFKPCEKCRGRWEKKDLKKDKDNGRFYCPRCYNEISINQYSFKPSPIFYKDPRENTVFMGVELEVEVGGEPENCFKLARLVKDKYNEVDNLLYLKYDSSIQNGFEIVTHPRTLRQHKKFNWSELLSFLHKNGASSYINNRCGLHIHVNRDIFGTEERYNWLKILWFFFHNSNNIIAFSKRNDRELNAYSFCWSKDDILRYRNSGATNHNRHAMINFTREGTVEFRLFRGTLYHKRFMASLQFCDALIKFAQSFSLVSFQTNGGKSSKNGMWGEFLIFIKNDYNLLYNYLTGKLKPKISGER